MKEDLSQPAEEETGVADREISGAVHASSANRETPRTAASLRTDAMRARMRRQAYIMVAVALLVLLITFAVPFALHFLQIKIP